MSADLDFIHSDILKAQIHVKLTAENSANWKYIIYMYVNIKNFHSFFFCEIMKILQI